MIEWDERHGAVERGTPGHKASAQVADLEADVAALDRIYKSSKWMTGELSYGSTFKEALKQGSINRKRNQKAKS